MGLYEFGRALLGVVLHTVYKVETVGIDNVPTTGGVLLCTNHISNLDPILVGVTSPRPVHFMAKEEIFKVPILKQILPKLNAFPVRRGAGDKQALRSGINVLKEGHVLGVFPEGTRIKTGQLGKGLSGVGFFALRTDAQVVPSAVIGPYKFFGRVTIIYGEPIDLHELKENKASAKEVTDVIMGKIQELLDKYQTLRLDK